MEAVFVKILNFCCDFISVVSSNSCVTSDSSVFVLVVHLLFEVLLSSRVLEAVLMLVSDVGVQTGLSSLLMTVEFNISRSIVRLLN